MGMEESDDNYDEISRRIAKLQEQMKAKNIKLAAKELALEFQSSKDAAWTDALKKEGGDKQILAILSLLGKDEWAVQEWSEAAMLLPPGPLPALLPPRATRFPAADELTSRVCALRIASHVTRAGSLLVSIGSRLPCPGLQLVETRSALACSLSTRCPALTCWSPRAQAAVSLVGRCLLLPAAARS